MGRPERRPSGPAVRADRRPDPAGRRAAESDRGGGRRRPAGRDDLALSPEHRRIIGLCRSPTTVADVASAISLPVGVVRVLLADLIPQGRIKVMTQRQTEGRTSADLLKEVLHGLRSL